MALITCHECKEQISDDAKSCPKCGARKRSTKWWLWAPLIIVVVIFTWGAITGPKNTRELADMEEKACLRDQGGGEWRASSGITLEMFCSTKASLIAIKRACEIDPSKC